MSETITITGVVASEPRHVVTSEGLPITNFRLASTLRRFDRKQNSWVDVGTNWYTVSSFRQLAANVAACVAKGERVIVTGRLRVRDWVKDETKGTSIDVEAEAVGHDLAWGMSTFARTISASSTGEPADAPGERSSESSAASQQSEPVPF